MSNLTTLDRFVGALLGHAVGDALGAPFETKTASEVASMLGPQPLMHREFEDPFCKGRIIPAGSVTDDTELTYAFAQSLLTGTFSQEDQFARYRALVHGDALSPFTGVKPYGFGGLTKQALAHPRLAKMFRDTTIPDRASNGSLMRIAPLALAGVVNQGDDAVFRYAAQASEITHRNDLAIILCATYTVVLHCCLEDKPWSITGLLSTRYIASNARCSAANLVQAVYEYPMLDIGLKRGAALETFRLALCAMVVADGVPKDNFRAGMEWVILQGGDTDTNAAVAGALLGARYGASGIPKEWALGLYDDTAKNISKAAIGLWDIYNGIKKFVW